MTGTAPTETTINSLETVTGSHTYAAPGTYQATVTVNVKGGAAVTAHFTVKAP